MNSRRTLDSLDGVDLRSSSRIKRSNNVDWKVKKWRGMKGVKVGTCVLEILRESISSRIQKYDRSSNRKVLELVVSGLPAHLVGDGVELGSTEFKIGELPRNVFNEELISARHRLRRDGWRYSLMG